MQENMNLVIAIVNRGFADEAMDAARAAGATGGTVLLTRGSGDGNDAKFYEITIHHEKELLLILAKADIRKAIMQAIADRVGLKTPAQGIAFSVPVNSTVGLTGMGDDEDDD